LAGVALLVASYLPLIIEEVTGNFRELRGMTSYVTNPPGYVDAGPAVRVVFAAIRIPAWPLTGWPFFELRSGLLLALAVSTVVALSGPLLLLRTWRHGATISGNDVEAVDERHGVAFVFGSLGLIVLALGLWLRAVSELNVTMTEHYHIAADPFVLLAAAILLGAIWTAGKHGSARIVRRALVIGLVTGFVALNAAHWPPLNSGSNWVDAQAAASRIERDASGGTIAMVPLFQTKGIQAYSYPLQRDGITLVSQDAAQTVVLLCDAAWINGCGGNQENQWIGANASGGALRQVDRFNAAPDRLMTVYRRGP
jgi:hypothetical protein